jgi:hypothetical protein
MIADGTNMTGHLFRILLLLAFSQSHTRTTTVLVDELNAGQFQGVPHCKVVSSSRHGRFAVG